MSDTPPRSPLRAHWSREEKPDPALREWFYGYGTGLFTALSIGVLAYILAR